MEQGVDLEYANDEALLSANSQAIQYALGSLAIELFRDDLYFATS